MENEPAAEISPFEIMAGKLEAIKGQLEEAAIHSRLALYRPEMNFEELRIHLGHLADLYRQQLVHKAFMTHRAFSVKKVAKRKVRPLTEERRQQLIAAGRKGGSKIGSLKKSMAAKANGAMRWRKAVGSLQKKKRKKKVIVAKTVPPVVPPGTP